MAMATATIANRGISYEPRLVQRVLDADGHDVRDPDSGRLVVPHEPKVRADLHRAGISDAQIEAVREGMRRVVAEGTGRRAQVKGEIIAGKTGTAQFWRGDVQDNHTWFIAFAPYDKPKYALCVLVQGAKSGGGVSAPIAQRIMEQCLAMDHGFEPAFAALRPAVGSFTPIEVVDYHGVPSPLLATTSAPVEPEPRPATIPTGGAVPFNEDDPETLDGIDMVPRAIPVERTYPRRPDIRPPADPRGHILWSPGATPSRPAPPDRSDVLKPFFQQPR
jgi:penicillin-binding protein 2